MLFSYNLTSKKRVEYILSLVICDFIRFQTFLLQNLSGSSSNIQNGIILSIKALIFASSQRGWDGFLVGQNFKQE